MVAPLPGESKAWRRNVEWGSGFMEAAASVHRLLTVVPSLHLCTKGQGSEREEAVFIHLHGAGKTPLSAL